MCMIALAAVCLRRTVYFADTCYWDKIEIRYVVNYAIAYAYCYLLRRLDLWPTVYMHDRYGTFYSTSLPLATCESDRGKLNCRPSLAFVGTFLDEKDACRDESPDAKAAVGRARSGSPQLYTSYTQSAQTHASQPRAVNNIAKAQAFGLAWRPEHTVVDAAASPPSP